MKTAADLMSLEHLSEANPQKTNFRTVEPITQFLDPYDDEEVQEPLERKCRQRGDRDAREKGKWV